MNEGTQKKYYIVIDVLRIISILAVLLIHTTTRTLEASSYDLHRLPWTLFLNQISRFAVPLFFMISGFVLEANYPFHANYFTYLKKRFSRIFIPYIFWSAIYYYFIYTRHTTNFLQDLIAGDASYQLYFIPSLLIFYIIFPFIHKFYNIFANKFILIVFALIQLAFLYQDYYIHTLPFFYPISIALLNYFVFILGTVASHKQEKILKLVGSWKTTFTISTLILVGYIFYEGQSLYFKTHNYLSFYSQWRPSIFVYTILLASILFYFLYDKDKYINVIKTLARLSFFVFFIHVIILEAVWVGFLQNIFLRTHSRIAEQVWYDPMYFLIVATISFLAAFISHKIPWVSKISG